MKKHRRWLGEANYAARLTENDVRTIRTSLNTETHETIARRFGIARSQITRIASGKTWSHIQ